MADRCHTPVIHHLPGFVCSNHAPALPGRPGLLAADRVEWLLDTGGNGFYVLAGSLAGWTLPRCSARSILARPCC